MTKHRALSSGLAALCGLVILASCIQPTAAVTPAATAIPSDWGVYQHQGLGWSLRYPPDWSIADEGEWGMSVCAADDTRFIVRDEPWLCEGTTKQVLQCLVAAAEQGFSEGYSDFRLVDARTVVAGERLAYLVDHTVELETCRFPPWGSHVTHVFVPYTTDRNLHAYTMGPFADLWPAGLWSKTVSETEDMSPKQVPAAILDLFIGVLSTLVTTD